MFINKDFSKRALEKEWLDTMDVSKKDLYRNLREFKWINRFLGSRRSLVQALEQIYQTKALNGSKQTLSILDLGCAAGDLSIAIDEWALTKKLNAKIIGIDINPAIIQYAQNNVGTTPSSQLELKVLDIFSPEFDDINCDIICLNNICHHFDDQDLILLLKKCYEKASLAVIINDLQRNCLSYYGIKILSKTLRLSHLAQHDGPLSVLRAFTYEELDNIIEAVHPKKYTIQASWLYRWQAILYS